MELARCEYIEHREKVIAVGNSGAGKPHIALGLGLTTCQKGMSVGFTTTAALVYELMEARDERLLLNLKRQLARLRLLIIDELGFVPRSTTGAELLFEVFSQRQERCSVLVTTNLPLDEWTDGFGSERLTGALLDRLTPHVHILRPHSGNERRQLLAQGQPAGRRFPVSRLARRRLAPAGTAPPYLRSLPRGRTLPMSNYWGHICWPVTPGSTLSCRQNGPLFRRP